jgi:hypothetical protein
VKKERIISGWPGGTVGRVKFGSGGVMQGDQGMLEPTGETINITHQTGRAVKNLKEISKEFLSPAPNLVNRAVIL